MNLTFTNACIYSRGYPIYYMHYFYKYSYIILIFSDTAIKLIYLYPYASPPPPYRETRNSSGGKPIWYFGKWNSLRVKHGRWGSYPRCTCSHGAAIPVCPAMGQLSPLPKQFWKSTGGSRLPFLQDGYGPENESVRYPIELKSRTVFK